MWDVARVIARVLHSATILLRSSRVVTLTHGPVNRDAADDSRYLNNSTLSMALSCELTHVTAQQSSVGFR